MTVNGAPVSSPTELSSMVLFSIVAGCVVVIAWVQLEIMFR